MLFIHVFRKSDCTVDNIHLKRDVESMLNIYFPFTKPSSHLTKMA